ncbi:MAG: 2-hydroxyacyl-CoA dehydratase [Candidatus Abyssobacteria bacterium SURF_17]|uniref:2-hydroxyacyl-CoA dehydratase n=1 Tax=Candidatus Abyssobacteria bacterium SURF_17 TaxID=2093361 RepID=A0A419EUN5_9BACT|nr:MAG: 2-hydroxyacyl-CoA dehydratase [Candidatus Abyssubacteria bacterium SURF_17]
MEDLRYFAEMASELNNAEIQAWKRAGKRVIGTVCSNIPEELIYAAGILPIRLRAPRLQDTSSADSLLHRINCSYTRSVLELLLRGELGFLDGIVTTNTCDHMLRLAGELQAEARMPFIHYFSMYHALGKAADEWFVLEMEKLKGSLEQAFSMKISDDDVRRAIFVYNRTRRLMGQLNEFRKADPPPLSGTEYFQIVLAGMSTPREQFNDRLEALLPLIQSRRAGGAVQSRLMVVGGGCDAPEFIEFIERKGARIVTDGLCFGMRHYSGTIDENDANPLHAIALRYTNRAACPAIINGFPQSYGILSKLIREWGVQGVICARLKFCDHWAGARKLLAEELRKDGLPLLDLEREYSTTSSGQMSTRIQAFLEMLKSQA